MAFGAKDSTRLPFSAAPKHAREKVYKKSTCFLFNYRPEVSCGISTPFPLILAQYTLPKPYFQSPPSPNRFANITVLTHRASPTIKRSCRYNILQVAMLRSDLSLSHYKANPSCDFPTLPTRVSRTIPAPDGSACRATQRSTLFPVPGFSYHRSEIMPQTTQ